MTERDARYGNSLREREVEKVPETASSSVIRHSSVTTETLEVGADARPLAVLSGHSTRTCGDFGGRTNAGEPCGQVLGPNRTRCAFHPDGPPEVVAAARAELARKAGEARQPHGDPTLRDPDFGSPAKIAKWCEQTAGKLLRGELTDLRTVDMALKAARLALDAYGVGALDQLDKLEALVRNRLQGGAPA